MSVSITTGRGGAVELADETSGSAVARPLGLVLDLGPQATSSRVAMIPSL